MIKYILSAAAFFFIAALNGMEKEAASFLALLPSELGCQISGTLISQAVKDIRDLQFKLASERRDSLIPPLFLSFSKIVNDYIKKYSPLLSNSDCLAFFIEQLFSELGFRNLSQELNLILYALNPPTTSRKQYPQASSYVSDWLQAIPHPAVVRWLQISLNNPANKNTAESIFWESFSVFFANMPEYNDRLALILNALLQAGIDINIKRKEDGNTPLMVAASFFNAPVVQFLLARKANPRELNTKGQSALTLAQESYEKLLKPAKSVFFGTVTLEISQKRLDDIRETIRLLTQASSKS